MTNQELIRLLKANSYKRIALDNDTGEPKTFYTYRRGLHINATDKLSFHIVPQSQSLGLGRFAICATGNGASSQVGTDCPELFFPRLLSYLKGETSGEEIIRYVTGNPSKTVPAWVHRITEPGPEPKGIQKMTAYFISHPAKVVPCPAYAARPGPCGVG